MRPVDDDLYGMDPKFLKPHHERNAVQRFFSIVFQASMHPTRFFETLSPSGGISVPLTFAIIVGWISAAIGYSWLLVFPQATDGLQEVLISSGVFKNHDSRPVFDLLTQWNIGVGAVILTPFFKTIEILLKSGCIFIGAALFSSKDEKTSGRISFESAVRTISYGHAPLLWMSLIPIAGSWISSLWQMIVTIVGIREVFQVSGAKALLYFSFPAIIFLFLILATVLLAGAAVFAMIATLLGQV